MVLNINYSISSLNMTSKVDNYNKCDIYFFWDMDDKPETQIVVVSHYFTLQKHHCILKLKLNSTMSIKKRKTNCSTT